MSNAQNGLIVIVLDSLINNDTVGDSKHFITATAHASINGAPYSDEDIIFSLDSSMGPFFEINNSTDVKVKPKNGAATVRFASEGESTGNIVAHIDTISDQNPVPEDQKPFEFSAICADNLVLTLEFDTCDMGTHNIATVVSRVGNVPINHTAITFDFTDNYSSVTIVDSDKTSTRTYTKGTDDHGNPLGIATVPFTSPRWTNGAVIASIIGDNDPTHAQKKDFSFIAPDTVGLTPFNIQVQTTDINSDINQPKYVIFNKFPANTPTYTMQYVTATIQLVNSDKPLGDGFDLEISYTSSTNSPSLNVSIKDDKNSYTKINQESTVTTDINGEIKLYLSCYDISTVNLTASIKDNQTLPRGTVSSQVQFIDPWVNIDSPVAHFSGQSSEYNLYTNGRHEILLYLRMKLIDSNNSPLTEATMPSIDDIYKSVKVIDYNSGIELGTGNMSAWSYSKDGVNTFCTQSSSSSSEFQILDTDSAINEVTLKYYIKSTDTTSSDVAIGFSIMPTGGRVTYDTGLNGKLITNPVVIKDGSIYSSYNQNIPTIKPLEPRSYNLNDLSIVSLGLTQYDNQHDSQPDTCNLTNSFREFRYKISFNEDRVSSNEFILHSYYFVEGQDELVNYCYSQKSINMYSYMYYLWPILLSDPDGTNISTVNEIHMASTRAMSAVDSKITPEPQTIYISLYIGFGNYLDDLIMYKYRNINIYDQYGNIGIFSLNPSVIPSIYPLSNTTPILLNDGASVLSDVNTPADEKKLVSLTKVSNNVYDGKYGTQDHWASTGVNPGSQIMYPLCSNACLVDIKTTNTVFHISSDAGQVYLNSTIAGNYCYVRAVNYPIAYGQDRLSIVDTQQKTSTEQQCLMFYPTWDNNTFCIVIEKFTTVHGTTNRCLCYDLLGYEEEVSTGIMVIPFSNYKKEDEPKYTFRIEKAVDQ